MKNPKILLILLSITVATIFLISAVQMPPGEINSASNYGSISRVDTSSTESKSVSSCMALLLTAANQAGIQWSIGNTGDETFEDGTRSCLVQFVEQPDTGLGRAYNFGLNETNKTPASSCKYDPMDGWSLATLNGYNARTYYSLGDTRVIDDQAHTVESREITVCMHAGGRNYHLFVQSWTMSIEASGPAPDPEPIAKIMISVAENFLPLTDETYEITSEPTEESVEEAVTETAEPTAEPTEVEPVVEVTPSTSDGEETTPEVETEVGTFDETWDSEQARAIRSPLVPAIGGLIGTGIAWLVAKGTSQAGQYASAINYAAPSSPPVAPSVITGTPPALPTEPPKLVTEPPPIQAEPINPPAEQKTPLELGFNLIKDGLSGVATTLDQVKDSFSFADSSETMDAIRKAMNTWKNTPSAESLADYIKSLHQSKALKMEDLSNKLSKAGKALDIVEAGMKAQKICTKRGYKGMDAVLTTYAEVGKKALVWGITKHPVVGVIDTVVGSTTTILLGSDNKIDVGALVDKSAEAWDKVTQEAGELYNSDIVDAGKKYELEGKLNLVNRIKNSVQSGAVTQEEGARRLRAVLDKFNKETPKL